MKITNIKKLFDKKWKIALSILFAVIVLNVLISVIFGTNIIENGFKSLLDALSGYTKEVNQLIIDSENANHDYENRFGGSWRIEQNAKWSDSNTALLTFNLSTVGKVSNVPKDYIVVLDISGSMNGTRLDKLKTNMEELTNIILSNSNNKMALITYNNTSKILSGLTSDRNAILSKIPGIQASGDTNYTAALKNVGEVLKNADYKSSVNRELMVLFFSDGFPNIDTPNQIGEYEYLKNEYSNLKVIGIQHEMEIGGTMEELKEISDEQIRTNNGNLMNKLLGVFNAYLNYDNYKIEYSLDNNYFYVESSDDIEALDGNVKLEGTSKNQKIVWDFGSDLVTGTKTSMTVKLVFKDEKSEGYFGTNDKIVVNYKVNGESEYYTVTNKESTVLKRPYLVIYDTNLPVEEGTTGCNIKDKIVDKYNAYSTVTMRDNELVCSGYQFVGWEIADDSTDDLIKLNDEKFIMPSHDVTIRAVWSKVGVIKTMGGTIHEKHTLYDQILTEVAIENGITTLVGTESEEFPIYYYTSNLRTGYKNNNNVIFANKCWKIIRTTETSGIKIIYNGKPDTNGSCPYYGNGNGGKDAQLEEIVPFYSSTNDAISDAGYMYNTVYSRRIRQMSTAETLIRNLSSMSRTDYYYADSISFDSSTGRYNLVSPKQYGQWSDHYGEVVTQGRYTCRKDVIESCDTVYYVFGGTSTTTKYVTVAGGKDIDDYTLTLGKGYTGTNPYNFTDVVNVSYVDWFNNYKNYNNYYICSDYSTSNNCRNLYYIIGTTNNNFTYVNMENKIKYGNSVKYENGVYTLTEDNAPFKVFWDWQTNYKTLNNNHYTCFNDTGVCSEVYYLNYVTKSDTSYITLKDGKKIEDALELMLGAEDSSSDVNKANVKMIDGAKNPNYVNTYDSTLKATIDKWYKDNMLIYTNYLEDTVFCNERGIGSIGSWNANGGNLTSTYLNFKASYTTGITCSKKIDSFTVSDELGNGDLTYPVGLLTYNEAVLAGEGANRTGSSYWTMSPDYFESNDFYFSDKTWYVFSTGAMDFTSLTGNSGVRPVVSLRPGIEYTRGDGSYKNPYVVDIA